MALAALATFAAGSSAITAQPRRAPSTAPLYPLSERDLRATREMGCECSFRAGRADLARVIGNELTIRTRAGRQVCRISDDQFSALSNGRGSAACAGLRLSLRPTGRVTTHMESDSASGPAALTVGQGRTRRTLAGVWGCAC
jgi:hypothetical protein